LFGIDNAQLTAVNVITIEQLQPNKTVTVTHRRMGIKLLHAIQEGQVSMSELVADSKKAEAGISQFQY